MDSKKINAFLTAVELGSLTSAAQLLGYTQSGLTHMMSSLENELGVDLLIRGKSGVRPSPAAHKLIPAMKELVAASEKLEGEAAQLCKLDFSTLHIGAYSSVTRQWIPSILAEYKAVCPDVQVRVSMSNVQQLYSDVSSGILDCAFVSYQPELVKKLVWLPLWDDELVAVVPSSSPLPSPCPVEHFDGIDFLMPSFGFELDIAPALVSADGRRIFPVSRNTNMDDGAIVSMVEHGLGETILTRLVMEGMNANVKCLSLSPASHRKLGIICGKRIYGERNFRRFTAACHSAIYARY